MTEPIQFLPCSMKANQQYQQWIFALQIPLCIFRAPDLSLLERDILAHILQREMEPGGCVSSNRHFAKFHKVSMKTVEAVLCNLRKLGYIRSEFDGIIRSICSNPARLQRCSDRAHSPVRGKGHWRARLRSAQDWV
jgi:DNA-binding transcriptional MocR family regulator